MEFHNEAMVEGEVVYSEINRQRPGTTGSGYEHAFCAVCAEGNYANCAEHDPVYTDPQEAHMSRPKVLGSSGTFELVPPEPVYAEPKEAIYYIEQTRDEDAVYNDRGHTNFNDNSGVNTFENNVYNEIIDGYSRIEEVTNKDDLHQKLNNNPDGSKEVLHRVYSNGNESHYDGDGGVYHIGTRENFYDEPKLVGADQQDIYHDPLEIKNDNKDPLEIKNEKLYDEAIEVRQRECTEHGGLYYSQPIHNMPQPQPLDVNHGYLETIPADPYANARPDDPYYSQPKDVPQYRNLLGVTNSLTYAWKGFMSISLLALMHICMSRDMPIIIS